MKDHRSFRAGPVDLLSVEIQLAAVGLQQAQQDVEKRALAATGRTDEAEELAFRNLQVKALESRNAISVLGFESESQMSGFNAWKHGSPEVEIITGGRGTTRGKIFSKLPTYEKRRETKNSLCSTVFDVSVEKLFCNTCP